MKPNNPLQIFKALYRYGGVPFARRSGKHMDQGFFFGDTGWRKEIIRNFPDTKFHFRKTDVSKWEFYTSLAPWMLANSASKVYFADKPLPKFISAFCQRNNIAVVELNALKAVTKSNIQKSVKPQLPAKIVTVSTPDKKKVSVVAPDVKKVIAPDVKKTVVVAAPVRPGIPSWFRAHPGSELLEKIKLGRPIFLYLPWIAEHGDVLIGRIGSEEYSLAPLDMVKSIDDNDVRRSVARFARENPDLYRRMVIRRLVPLREHVKGIILTFDWAPVMRIVASVCKELDIPVILIPHESVFVTRNMYYVDITAKASVPVADVILGWGELQRNIFESRGYPSDRFVAVGAPKFDSYYDYKPQLSRDQFYRLFGLSPLKKTILFASQPLDSQLDAKSARKSQQDAITDLLNYAQDRGHQILVRLPPSRDDILGVKLREIFSQSSWAAYDDATCYLVSPEEAVFHSDVVTSLNSTMLFEGVLSGKPALSMRYIDFEPFWSDFGIPDVSGPDKAFEILDKMFDGKWRINQESVLWAAKMLGSGSFDGKANERIRDYLEKVVGQDGEVKLVALPKPEERLFQRQGLDVVAIPSSTAILETTQLYLKHMLNAQTVISSKNAKLPSVASVDVFLQWGITDNSAKAHQRELAGALGRSVVIVEDGFIRSVDIGLSGEPALSIILDDTTAYYNAMKASRLERLLQEGLDLAPAETARARAAMDKIVGNRVSKYNHAPYIKLPIGSPDRKKILLVDQRYGDQSIISGLADDTTFDRMLVDVLETRRDCDIIVKQHPDAIKGGKSSYFSNERLAKFKDVMPNLYPIVFDINPFSLFDIVDEVFVATSGMGFEALMAGKTVHCYGMPYYAGWGVTTDKIKLPRRTRTRSVEDLFHFAYVECSRYYDPDLAKLVSVEGAVDYIVKHRKATGFIA